MCRPRITINAAVLATAIRIQACLKADIRAVVAGDDRLRTVAKELRNASRPFLIVKIAVNNIDILEINMQFVETVCRAPRRASSANRLRALRRFSNDRPIILSHLPHLVSSHEHKPLSSSLKLVGTLAAASGCFDNFGRRDSCCSNLLLIEAPMSE